MASVLNTLYPPMIETFMPAFVYDESMQIIFSYSPYNSRTEVHKIHVSIVDQKTNKSVFPTTKLNLEDNELGNVSIIDHILILNKVSGNSIKISPTLLKDGKFKKDTFYKVQLRFDQSVSEINSTYLVEQRYNFSEWSSVCLIKAIDKLEIKINTGLNEDWSETPTITVQPGIVPITARLKLKSNSTNATSKERLQKYKIKIYSQSDENDILDSIDWTYTGDQQDNNDIYWLASLDNAIPDIIYVVQIDAITKNQYELPSKIYYLKIANYDPVDFTPQWKYKTVVLNSFGNKRTQEEENAGKDEKIVTSEDGQVVFTITSKENMPSGFLYVKRASSLDNYKKWELISCTSNEGVVNEIIVDSTVASMVSYKYACQYRLLQNDIFTTTKYDSKTIYPDFYDILLYRQGKQLAIRYNEQISSYSSVVNRQVINTLGGKYPKFAENAKMNYKKMSISGLLTVEEDFNRKFIDDRDYPSQMNDYNHYMNGKYEVRNDTVADDDISYKDVSSINQQWTYDATHTNWIENNKSNGQKLPSTLHDLFPKDNWWLEREFREQALAWLNDGEPKLFRSMTEGNMVVMLTDISLTPNTQLSRRIYNVSMTAYEVEDGYSLETLSSLGIVIVPNEYEDYQNLSEEEQIEKQKEFTTTVSTIGQSYQIKDIYGSSGTGIVKNNKLFNRENPETYTMQEQFNSLLYTGILDTYQAKEDSFQFKNLKIQFESEPQWYEASTLKLLNLTNGEIPKEQNSYLYGYKLGLLTIKDNKTEDASMIFVNEKGYYQVPSNIIIKEIYLYDNAKATLDYQLFHDRVFNPYSVPSEIEINQRIVGQISGKWLFDNKISEKIKSKYDFYHTNNQDKILERHYLGEITAIGYDGTPYTMLDILFEKEDQPTSILVGQTGVHNLMTDYPIKELTFKGRRMFRKESPFYSIEKPCYYLDASTLSLFKQSDNEVEGDILIRFYPYKQQIVTLRRNNSNNAILPYNTTNDIENPIEGTIYGVWENKLQLYLEGSFHDITTSKNTLTIYLNKKMSELREWEFSIDESAKEHDSSFHLSNIYWNNIPAGRTTTEVKIYEDTNPSHYIYYIDNIKDDNIPEINGYYTTGDIEDPIINTVYGFKTENENKKLKIYYIDHKWYDIDFIEGTNKLLALAKVPVYGMVNYRGNLIKVKYAEA